MDTTRKVQYAVTNAAAIPKKNPAEFLASMDKIIKLTDVKTNNLGGDVFEMGVGYYHNRLCKNLDINKIIYIDRVQRELDVFTAYADAVKVCECKRPEKVFDYLKWTIGWKKMCSPGNGLTCRTPIKKSAMFLNYGLQPGLRMTLTA